MRKHTAWAFCFAWVVVAFPALANPPDCTKFADNPSMGADEKQWCQALAFKASFLARGEFVVTAPVNGDGVAKNVKSRLTTLFSNNGGTSVSGTVSIGELKGTLRLKLASTDNSLYYGRQVKVAGSVSTTDAQVVVYSPVDVNLWTLAAVLVDGSDRNAPPPEDGLILKGYLAKVIEPGSMQDFSAELVTFAGDFYLLLDVPNGIAKDITIDIVDN